MPCCSAHFELDLNWNFFRVWALTNFLLKRHRFNTCWSKRRHFILKFLVCELDKQLKLELIWGWLVQAELELELGSNPTPIITLICITRKWCIRQLTHQISCPTNKTYSNMFFLQALMETLRLQRKSLVLTVWIKLLNVYLAIILLPQQYFWSNIRGSSHSRFRLWVKQWGLIQRTFIKHTK